MSILFHYIFLRCLSYLDQALIFAQHSCLLIQHADAFIFQLKCLIQSCHYHDVRVVSCAIIRFKIIDTFRDALVHPQTVDGVFMPATNHGIPQGCSLSPLIGALALSPLDNALAPYCNTHGLVYYRYQDDWICLIRTRRQLRTITRKMNAVLAALQLPISQPKTWLGRTSRGIDFLGYHIRPHHPLTPAAATQANHTNILIGKLDSGD